MALFIKEFVARSPEAEVPRRRIGKIFSSLYEDCLTVELSKIIIFSAMIWQFVVLESPQLMTKCCGLVVPKADLDFDPQKTASIPPMLDILPLVLAS